MVDEAGESARDERGWQAEHRYRAVREALESGPVAEVARQHGTTRQSLHAWLRRYEAEGYEGLLGRSWAAEDVADPDRVGG